jgi:ABC-type glucose/galactose transport system permease subunit
VRTQKSGAAHQTGKSIVFMKRVKVNKLTIQQGTEKSKGHFVQKMSTLSATLQSSVSLRRRTPHPALTHVSRTVTIRASIREYGQTSCSTTSGRSDAK